MDAPKSYNDIKTGRSSLDNWIKTNYNEFYNYLKNKYGDIDIKVSLYMYYNGINEVPLCPSCGSPVKFHGYKYGFSKFCSTKCAQNDKEVRDKLKKTCEEKYGDDYRKVINDKGRETKLKLYNDANYNNIEKAKQTCIIKYGVDNPMKCKDVKQKSKETCLKKYGNEYYLASDTFKNNKTTYIDKSKQTCIIKYGVDNPMKLEVVKNKVQNTCLYKYGVPWNCMRKEAHNSRNSNSYPNTLFQQLLDDNNIQYEKEFIIENKSYDFKIDNILVEINPSPTHNTNWNPFGGKVIDKDYHLNKTLLAKDNGYNLIHIWDWDNISDIIELFKQKNTIYARECEIKEVNKNDCNAFLNKFHLQKSCRGQIIRIGLYYKDELVSIMTFGKPRYNKKYEYELLRLCYHNEYKIVGGSEKMFKYFKTHYNPSSIISYCDNSKFNGNVYETLGFIKSNNIAPSKHWYNCKTQQHITDNLLRQRGYDQIFGTSYGKGTDNNQLMINNGFVEIYDAGQITWNWKG